MRRMSAPDCLITSCGAVTLPSDFDILRPCSSSTKPWVSTTSNGARPRGPQAFRSGAGEPASGQQRGVERAAVLVGALEIHHRLGAAVVLSLDAGERRKMHRVFQHEGV